MISGNKVKKYLVKAPPKCGVYLFLDKSGKIIYVGKAANLKNRVKSYFQKASLTRPLKSGMVEKIAKIKWRRTDSEIEALILEANLIKTHQPRFNVLFKDASDYFYVGISHDTFPKILISHQVEKYKIQNTRYKIQEFIGPFTDGTTLKKTLNVIRKIFPFCTCREFHNRPCLNSQIGRCLNVCCLKPELAQKNPEFQIKLREYKKNIDALKKIIRGQKRSLILNLNQEMKKASRKEEYEKAAAWRDQIENLREILAHKQVLIQRRRTRNWPEINRALQKLIRTVKTECLDRIEAYDISHISGTKAVGSMAVFKKGEISAEDYRKFKIRKILHGDDPAMIKEVIGRRVEHKEWRLPDLILVDGGRIQLNAALQVLKNNHLSIPVVALAKRKNELYLPQKAKPLRLNSLPQELKFMILRIRDQAHRFAIKYHRKLRSKIY